MKNRLCAAVVCGICFASGLVMAASTGKSGDPADDLPPHIQRLTWFGERADWRPDGKRFVFLNRAYGDVYEYDLESKRITACTDHFKHHGFVRALYLSNGDILLSGPVETFDRTDKIARQRARDASFLSVLDRSLTKAPVPLGIQCNEGPAVSRSRLRLAWTHGEQDQISMGDLVYEDGVPRMKNVKLVLTSTMFPSEQRPRKWIETQSFIPPDDTKLTVTGYELNDTENTDSFILDLNSGKLNNISHTTDRYEETEGVFPDGKTTLVESAEQKSRWPLVDLYRLSLDGSGRKERLTYFTDHPGWKAAEGVISDDGKFMLFQNGKGGMESGQGFSIFLYSFDSAQRAN